ncbi:MAG: DUF5615 family PIN-like protein [Candidatus Dormibacteraceae bacterium]
MRLLLDAHLSGRVIGRHLRKLGHDVIAIDEDPGLEGIDDEEVLALATREGRVLVTHNVHDFPEILRQWAEEGRDHAGCVVLVGIGLHRFGPLIRTLEATLQRLPGQQDWVNCSMLAGRRDPA